MSNRPDLSIIRYDIKIKLKPLPISSIKRAEQFANVFGPEYETKTYTVNQAPHNDDIFIYKINNAVYTYNNNTTHITGFKLNKTEYDEISSGGKRKSKKSKKSRKNKSRRRKH